MLRNLSGSHSKWQSLPGYKPMLPGHREAISDFPSRSRSACIHQHILLALSSKYIQKLIVSYSPHSGTHVPATFITHLSDCNNFLFAPCAMYSPHSSHLEPTLLVPFPSHLGESWPTKFCSAPHFWLPPPPPRPSSSAWLLCWPPQVHILCTHCSFRCNSLPNAHTVCFLTSSGLGSNILLEKPSQTTLYKVAALLLTPLPAGCRLHSTSII